MIAPAIAVACFGWATIVILAIELGKQREADTNVHLGYVTAILLVLLGTLLLVSWLLT